METISKSIYSFKRGDEVVRLQPSKGFGDRSYLGEKLTFIGCLNGSIYLEVEPNSFMAQILKKSQLVLPLDIWSDDWDYYIDPKELFSKEPVVNLKYLQSLLNKAIAEENFEEAERLKKQIENL